MLPSPPSLPVDTVTHNGAQRSTEGSEVTSCTLLSPHHDQSGGHGSCPAILVAPAVCDWHAPVRQVKHLEKGLFLKMDESVGKVLAAKPDGLNLNPGP